MSVFFLWTERHKQTYFIFSFFCLFQSTAVGSRALLLSPPVAHSSCCYSSGSSTASATAARHLISPFPCTRSTDVPPSTPTYRYVSVALSRLHSYQDACSVRRKTSLSWFLYCLYWYSCFTSGCVIQKAIDLNLSPCPVCSTSTHCHHDQWSRSSAG